MKSVIFLSLVLTLAASAQPAKHDARLTGVLSQDLFSSVPVPTHGDSLAMVDTRSALKAGLLSLVVPGAGQAYNGDYLKAAGFFAVEVASWVVNVMWTHKAQNQTSYFQTYADGTAADGYLNGHYSVARYATWIQQNLPALLQYNAQTDPTQIAIADKYAPLMVVNNGSPAPWSRVNWDALNKVESAIGGYFSHMLPVHGLQQYYELIGKYPQFRQGWDDSPYATGNTSFVAFMDYDTPHSSYYMDQRGKANSLYAVASTAVGVVLVNHFASAIESAIWAHNHEKIIQANVGLFQLPQGMGYQTELQLAVHF